MLPNNCKYIAFNTQVYTTTELHTDSSDKHSDVPEITKFESKEWVEQTKQ